MSKKVCIVGAGPSGLVTIKELLNQDISITCFEKQDSIGGAFNVPEKGGQSYDSLKLTVSNYFMAYSDFMPDTSEDRRYWSATEYKQYLLDYVDHNGLSDHIRTSHEVINASIEGNKVVVTVSNEQGEFNEVYDHFIICSGSNSIPKIPTWKNQHLFQGKLSHSVEYKNADEYKDKKVVCIGIGESGADIVHEISQVASSCKVLIRDYPNVIARWVNGYTNDAYTTYFFYAAKTMGINSYMKFQAWHSLKFDKNLSKEGRLLQQWVYNRDFYMGKFFTKSDVFIEDVTEGRTQLIKDEPESFTASGIRTRKGEEIEADLVICNTGYRTDFGNFSFGEDFVNPRKLFKNMISPEHGTLISLIGWARPTQGGLPACSEMQARYLAQLITGKKELPSKKALHRSIEKDRVRNERMFRDSSNITSLISYHDFMIDLAKLIGCKPKKVYWNDLKLSRKLLFGSHLSAFYRISNSVTKESAVRTIKSLPVAYTNKRNFIILFFVLLFNPLSRLSNLFMARPNKVSMEGSAN